MRIESAALLCSLMATGAFASAPRTFVSSTGVDTNPCSRTAPCRSFGAAVVLTSSGGSVIALDSAGYGPVTIGQSVSLIAPEGVYAGISATAGSAIAISGTTASDVVVLRGLSLEGGSSALYGIYVSSTNILTLHVQRCSISRFTQDGVVFSPLNSGAYLFVDDTSISDNDTGLFIESLSPTSRLSMNRSSLERNQLGCWIRGSSATITSSAVIGNGDTGIYMETGSTKVTIDRCTVTDNAVGIRTAGPVAVVALISNTIITHNTTGVSGGLLWTRLGDSTYVVKTNTLSFNGTDGAFTNTFTAK